MIQLEQITQVFERDSEVSEVYLPPCSTSCGQNAMMREGPLDSTTWFSMKHAQINAEIDRWKGQAASCEQLQEVLHQQFISLHEHPRLNAGTKEEHLISRRTAIATIAMLPTALFLRTQHKYPPSLVLEEFLPQCAASLTACWHLLRGDGLSTVAYALPRYMPTLELLAQHPSTYQKAAASLASQGYLLMGLIALHQLQFQERVQYCQQAVAYAKVAGESVLLITALTHLGMALYRTGQPSHMLHIYQEAEGNMKDVPLLLQSKVFAESALALAQLGKAQETLHSLEKARALCPEETQGTPSFLSTDVGLFSLIVCEGLALLDLGTHP